MQKKHLIITVIVVVAVCAAAAFGLTAISAAIKANSQKDAGPSVVGGWTEDSTGVAVTFTDDGVFKIMNSDAAVYSIDTKAGTMTFKYASAYGGQQVEMSYNVTSTKLTLTKTSTGEVQTYTRTSSN